MDNLEKSSRYAADYFELLIAQGISDYFNTGDDFSSDTKKLKDLVLAQRGGIQKISDQNDRYKISISLTTSALDKYKSAHGPVTKVDWVGRNLGRGTKADVLITYEDQWLLGISVKSVGVGSGTLDNAGKEMCRLYFGLDVDERMAKLKKDLYEKIGSGNFDDAVSTAPWSKLRSLKHRFPELSILGKEVGNPLQKMATEQSAKSFNDLTPQRKLALVKKMLGVNTDEKMLFLLVSGKKVTLKEDSELLTLLGGQLTALVKTSKRFSILSNGKPLIGVQSSFTNGVGLSAFCQRSFLDWK